MKALVFAGAVLCAFVVAGTCTVQSGDCTSSYEVALDRAYRSYDAIFPLMRESYRDDDGKFKTVFEDLLPWWTDGRLAANAFERFRVEYPDEKFSNDEVRQALKNVIIERVPLMKIVSVTIRSHSPRLSECLVASFARSLSDFTSAFAAEQADKKLVGLRDDLKAKKDALNSIRTKLAAFGQDERGKLNQSAEYVKNKREYAEKLYPEYKKAFEEYERQNRNCRLDGIVVCVLGPVPDVSAVGVGDRPERENVQEWPAGSPDDLCFEAEKHQLAEAERQRREWNDRWQDRLEQIGMRAECPRRKYLVQQSSSNRFGMDEYCSGNPAVDTNSALFGFLGCRFGDRSNVGERYVRLDRPFEGFPWVRYDVCRSCNKIARCDARLTFRTQGLSKVPFERVKKIQILFKERFGLAFAESDRGESYFSEALGEGDFRIGLFVTNALVHTVEGPYVEYTMGFEIVNERVLPLRVRRMQETNFQNWRDILHVTYIPRARRNDESAWCYSVTKGKSTEELLDEFIKTGDRSILKLGKHEVGTPVSWSGGGSASGYFSRQCTGGSTGYFCTEWEADLYMAHLGAFVKLCDDETKTRISAKLYGPAMFHPRDKSKTGTFTVGKIFCELIPGDRVIWDTERSRRTGTVCAEGECGEYWDCIKKSVKDIETIECAREEDWAPTALTKEYERKRDEIRSRVHRVERLGFRRSPNGKDRALMTFDLTCKNLIAATNLLADCLAGRRPGIYQGPHTEHILDMSYPSREYARRKILHRENWCLDDYQYSLYAARREVLGKCFPEGQFGDGVPDQESRLFSLSRYERERFRLGDKWWKELSFPRYDHSAQVVLRHHAFDEEAHVFSCDEVRSARHELERFTDRLVDFATEEENGRRKTEGEHVICTFYEVLYSAFSSKAGHMAVSEILPDCCRLAAANLHQGPVMHVLKRLMIEFNDNLDAWKFAECVLSEETEIDKTSFAEGRTKAKKDLEDWLPKIRKSLNHDPQPALGLRESREGKGKGLEVWSLDD